MQLRPTPSLCVVFIHETPQASSGFTPFGPLFEWYPSCLLDVAREMWETQLAPFCSIFEYIMDMQEQINHVASIIKEHILEAQREQQRVYNHPVQPQEFQARNTVLLLLPSTNCKILARGGASRPSQLLPAAAWKS